MLYLRKISGAGKSIRRTCGAPICAARWRASAVFGVAIGMVPQTVDKLAAFRRAQERLRCARRRSRVALQSTEDVDPLRVFERDGWRCHLCGRKVDRSLPGRDPMGQTLDHVVPLAEGGAHSYANTALAHKSCNSRKGHRATVAGEQLRLLG